MGVYSINLNKIGRKNGITVLGDKVFGGPILEVYNI